MTMAQPPRFSDTDPRRLRELFSRTGTLALEHAVPSVIVGLAGREGEPLVSELFEFIESALRMEDSIFRMTRERAVLFVADVGREQAEQVLERLLQDFHVRFPSAAPVELQVGYFRVEPGSVELTAKTVLPSLFGPR
jgi:hypothetical protein